MNRNIFRIPALFCFLILGEVVDAQKVILVNVNDFADNGWEKGQVNKMPSGEVSKNATDLISIVCRPKVNTPFPLRPGAVYFSLPLSELDTNLASVSIDPSLARIQLRNNAYDGVFLKDISQLKYSTYTEPSTSSGTRLPPAAPILSLQIDVNGDDKWDPIHDNNINFEPIKQPRQNTLLPTPVNFDRWQEWKAFDGFWNLTNPDPVTFPDNHFTLTQLLAADKYKDAKIINTTGGFIDGSGGIRFTVTNAYINFKGYLDAFKITTPLKVIRTPAPPGAGGGELMYDYDGLCMKIVDVPWWREPPWPLFRNPLFIAAVIAMAIAGYTMYRKTKSKFAK
ncbi:hypothetical protein [Flavitalea sp.]|nr:hypothetical protein [Flavitalea sp.]